MLEQVQMGIDQRYTHIGEVPILEFIGNKFVT